MEYEVEVIIRSKRTQEHTTSVVSHDEAVLTLRNGSLSVDKLEALISATEKRMIPDLNVDLTA